MRGKAKEEPYRPCHPGITPACAGKRSRRTGRRWSSRDHPRVCGEKVSPAVAAQFWKGSPPRMRGKVPRMWNRSDPSGDHPRVCGEKCSGRLRSSTFLGSPPRMRGKGKMEREQNHQDRITPAYAGKSEDEKPEVRCNWDHPRVCGEKTKKIP